MLYRDHILHKNGRPTRTKQLGMQEILRLYFERGLTASFTAEKTGINIKTVCKYYEIWFNELNELAINDFLERQKKERERIILSYDQLIFEEYELLDYVKNEIEKIGSENKSIPRYLLSSNLEIIESIVNLNEKKMSFTIQRISWASNGEEVEEIDEESMKEIVRHLVLKEGITPSTLYSADHIMHEIIKFLKCDDKRARGILGRMKELGLVRCRKDGLIDDNFNEYDFLKFALMRDYIKEKEIKDMKNHT